VTAKAGEASHHSLTRREREKAAVRHDETIHGTAHRSNSMRDTQKTNKNNNDAMKKGIAE
jgi:hypothetical protein